MIEVLVNNKWPLKVPDHRQNPFKFGWENWEKEFLQAAHDTIQKGDVILDVGAENGDLSALFAQWADGPLVGLIEPSPDFWPVMRQTFEANGITADVAAFCGFASDTSNSATFWGWPPESTIIPNIAIGFRHLYQDTITTPEITIDRFATMSAQPNVIFIDTEGSELRVLKGARETLLNGNPKVFVAIHPSFMREMYDTEPEKLHAYMQELGYSGHLIATDHEEHWLFTKETP